MSFCRLAPTVKTAEAAESPRADAFTSLPVPQPTTLNPKLPHGATPTNLLMAGAYPCPRPQGKCGFQKWCGTGPGLVAG